MSASSAKSEDVKSPAGQPLEFRHLDAACRRDGFSCGLHEIDKWFRKTSVRCHDGFKSRVTTAHFLGNTSPVGFYSLRIALEDESLLDRSDRHILRPERRVFASLQLEYIAVQRSLLGMGLGEQVLIHAVNAFHDVVLATGIVAMTLVAANERAVRFYERLAFRRYGSAGSQRMLLPALTAVEMRRLLAPPTD